MTGKILCAALFLFATVLLAQSERANLTGAVSDPSGAPVANVTVSVIHLAAKSFVIRESKRLDFRGEAFNLLNRTVFAAPGTNLNSTSFGLVTSQSNSPRQMQVALKFYW